MKLLIEQNFSDVKPLIESVEGNRKEYFIEGIFLQADNKNRNGRIYPMPILEAEVERFINEQINTNSVTACGELNHPSCFHEQTELLTVYNGWKKIKDVKIGELIYTYNLNNNNIEIKPVLQLHISDYAGKMLEFRGRNFYTLVTPNHRFVMKNRNGVKRLEDAQTILNGWKDRSLAHDAIITCHDTELINDINTIVINEIVYDKKSFFAFLGIYLSEGYCGKKDNAICISQNEGWKADIIRKILTDLHSDIKWNEHIRITDFGNKNIVFQCSNKSLNSYLRKFGICYDKYIDKDLFDCIDTESARIFLESFILGDGRGTLGKKYSQVDAFSTSKQLIEDISQMAMIAGYSISFHSETCKKDKNFKKRIVKKENVKELFFCNFKNTNGKYIDNRFLSINEIDYHNKVYCITVENSTFFARDGNNTFWSGNSDPSVNLERISHRILTLRKEGKNFIGKAKVLIDQPCGKIVKGLMDEGLVFGVSSRAIGSLIEKEGFSEVQNDLRLSTIDIVSEPSVSDAIVENIMESKEWDFIDGKFVQVFRENIRKAKGKKNLEEAKIKEFHKLINSFKSKSSL